MFNWGTPAVDTRILLFIKSKQDKIIKDLEFKIGGLENSVRDKAKEVSTLKEEVADLKLKKKIEEEDIKHMVKIRLEQVEIEKQKALLDLTQKKEQEVGQIKDQYRDKIEGQLHKELDRINGMYNEVLKRLPNVEVMFGKEKKG